MSKIFSGLTRAINEKALVAIQHADAAQSNQVDSAKFITLLADLHADIHGLQSVKDAMAAGKMGPISTTDLEAFLRRANDRFFSQESKKVDNRPSSKAAGTKADDDGTAPQFDLELELETFFTGGRQATTQFGAALTALDDLISFEPFQVRYNNAYEPAVSIFGRDPIGTTPKFTDLGKRALLLAA